MEGCYELLRAAATQRSKLIHVGLEVRDYYFHAKFLLVITHGKHLQIKEQDKEKLKFYCWLPHVHKHVLDWFQSQVTKYFFL